MENENTIIEATPFQPAQDDQRDRFFRIRPLQTILVIVFLVLTTATIFTLTARAVRVAINPAPDTFRFTSGFSYQIGERYLMLPGQYSFTAGKEGYYLLSDSVVVNDDPDQEFEFILKKLPGILRLETQPEVSAEILLDQKQVGVSPLILDQIEPGLHDISVRSARYLNYDTEISIDGMRQTQTLSIPLSPAWANITISSQPSDAQILIDGVVTSTTPDSIEALQGERSIQIRKKGYKTWQTELPVRADIDQTLDTVILEKSDGKVSVASTPAGANVNINGRYKGQTPIRLTLAPSLAYEIRLSKAGYRPVTRNITVDPDEDLSLSNKLSPVLGVVQLMVEPAGAELFVDDMSYGDATQRLSLTVKQHEIKIMKEGYSDYITIISPQPDSSQQLLIRLQTEDEARIAAIATTITNAVNQTLKLIIPDQFEMGAGRREPGRRSNEIQKRVTLTRAFYLSTTEVTNEQFKRFDSTHDSGMLGRALLSDADRPVVNLSWRRAVEFCNWLSDLDGLPAAYEQLESRWKPVTPMNTGYRLPTEAEWVRAARYANGPEPTRFPWGENMPPVKVLANYADESAANMVPYYLSGYDDSFRGPAPAGNYPANELGIHDLAGNVAEWIHDYYSVETPKETLIDPTGPELGDYHVIRGSSYQHGRFSELRWTYRDYGDDSRPDVGFRVARFLE
ncbi:MAG TPA: PEGA domain-containing protein [Pseudomonadales bacterium]|jgi:formylglycine-generating enzyme required for sulfatase activity|nr:hypothetical protein [Gammaproteobacteria bacterium]MDP6024360.1 PEGA domain-containing protein [Pseudomonadales bacterium]MDP6316557.1 PEGA domain-containing protein [Pseudomonadales bacterium]MDP7315190.1 PEGA domain-containing protein [Pseudomonadales bacterium]HJP51394.1 PEGA domain-containing protein [Pseudomonadales bacterium]|tara:strand:- start:2111 stop:4156 length:2046 start_codon:yes stop_codon:yes gene_type:complete